MAAQSFAGQLSSQRCGDASSFLVGGLGGALIDWVGGCPSRQTFWADYEQQWKCISKHFRWAAAGVAGCLQGALVAGLMRVVRGALFSWKACHLKADLLVGGLGACIRWNWREALAVDLSARLVGCLGGALFGRVGGRPSGCTCLWNCGRPCRCTLRNSFWLTALVNTVRLGWRAALGAHSSVECLEGCLGPQFFIELMGGFVLSEDSGSVRFSQSC